jgi:multiple sugar transport system permease protein
VKRTASNILSFLLAVGVAALFATPLVWMFAASLKSPTELAANPYQLMPKDAAANAVENYVHATTTMPYLRYLRNSVVLCVGSVAGTLLSSALVAYGFARLRWRGRNFLFGVLIATMLLPWHVTMIPRFLLLRELGLYDSLGALILPTFLGDAISIFLLRQFFRTIPEELSEAARMEGLSEWGVFWRIVLPLSKPALATVAIFQFVAAWNDFSGPLLYLRSPERFPLAYGLERFVSSYGDQTHLLMAASVLFTLPVIVLFFFAQRTFLKGIVAGGVKE